MLESVTEPHRPVLTMHTGSVISNPLSHNTLVRLILHVQFSMLKWMRQSLFWMGTLPWNAEIWPRGLSLAQAVSAITLGVSSPRQRPMACVTWDRLGGCPLWGSLCPVGEPSHDTRARVCAQAAQTGAHILLRWHRGYTVRPWGRSHHGASVRAIPRIPSRVVR